VGREWWQRVLDLPFLVSEGVIDEQDASLVTLAETATEAWDHIRSWYRDRGQPLFG
jgi:predicted Rossmann-fold nucleotide-binding protein